MSTDHLGHQEQLETKVGKVYRETRDRGVLLVSTDLRDTRVMLDHKVTQEVPERLVQKESLA